MKLLSAILLAGVLAGVWGLRAEGPDDQFIRVYNLIQQAEALQENGQNRAAVEKYTQAREALLQLESNHPRWNEKIIKYRKNYLAEKLAALGASPAPPAAAPAPAAAETVPPAPPNPLEARVAELTQEIAGLKTDRDTLQAKLREALSAQPAAVDPRELARAEEQLKELRRENDQLKVNVTQQQEKLAKAADPVALEEAQQALREAKQALAKQGQTVDSLAKQKQDLEQQLKKLRDRADARAQREEEKAQEKARKQAPAAAPAPAVAEPRAVELEQKLKQAQKELADQRQRAEVLQAEKAALEKRLADLRARPAVPVAPPVAVAIAPPAPEKPAADTKAAKALEKAQVRQLERERDELRKRVALLSRQVEDRQAAKGAAQTEQTASQLAILRARLEVYEARQVPYAPEELALMKRTAVVSTKPEPKPARKSRELPAGAATLVAEAQRAFQTRKYEEAEDKFQQALKLDAANVAVLDYLAAAQIERNRLEEAEATLKRALAEDATEGNAQALMGLVRLKQKRLDEALEVLSRAAQIVPDNPDVQNYLGLVLSEKGQRAAAETAFRKAVQLLPDYAEAHINLAVVYARQTPPFLELARWHYQKALNAGHPSHPELEKWLTEGLAK